MNAAGTVRMTGTRSVDGLGDFTADARVVTLTVMAAASHGGVAARHPRGEDEGARVAVRAAEAAAGNE